MSCGQSILAAGDHREISFNGGANLTPRIPEPSKRESKVRLHVIKQVSNSAHAGLDILQARLAVSETILGKAKVELRDMVVRHGSAFCSD